MSDTPMSTEMIGGAGSVFPAGTVRPAAGPVDIGPPCEKQYALTECRMARLERQRDELAGALRELVRLKDLHDKLEDAHQSLGKSVTLDDLYEAWKDYRRNKPLAWANARALLDRMKP